MFKFKKTEHTIVSDMRTSVMAERFAMRHCAPGTAVDVRRHDGDGESCVTVTFKSYEPKDVVHKGFSETFRNYTTTIGWDMMFVTC